MKKWVASELIILIFTMAIVLLLVPELQSSSINVSNRAISQNDDYKTITFNLLSGQTVTGKLSYTGDTFGAWFQVYDSAGKAPLSLKFTNFRNQVNFTFTADMDGEYYIAIKISTLTVEHISYDYTISSPILGLSYLTLIEVTSTIGIVLMALIALVHFKIKRKELKTSNN